METSASNLSLPEKILLLAIDDESGWWEGFAFNAATAGAALVELLRRGRVTGDEQLRVYVIDKTPTGDRLADSLLAHLGTERQQWSEVIRSRFTRERLSDFVAESLVGRGILDQREGRGMWVFKRTEFPTRDARPEQQIRGHLREVVLGDGEIPLDAAVILALLRAAGGLPVLLTRDEIRARHARLREICHQPFQPQEEGRAAAVDFLTGVVIRATAMTVGGDPESLATWW